MELIIQIKFPSIMLAIYECGDNNLFAVGLLLQSPIKLYMCYVPYVLVHKRFNKLWSLEYLSIRLLVRRKA